MLDRVEELAAQGLALSSDERIRLLILLLNSLKQDAPGDIDAAWSKEIEHRIAAYERGDSQLFDLDEVMDEAARIAP